MFLLSTDLLILTVELIKQHTFFTTVNRTGSRGGPTECVRASSEMYRTRL